MTEPGPLLLDSDPGEQLLIQDGPTTELVLTESSGPGLVLASPTYPLMLAEAPVAGPRGRDGVIGVTVEALVNLNAYTVVKVMTNGKARPASSLILGDGEAAVGITTIPALASEQVPVRTAGAIITSAPFPTGPLYLGVDGTLTTDPSGGLFQLRVAYAQTPTLLVIRIDPPIYF